MKAPIDVKVGDGVNIVMWTDIEAATVIRRTEKRLYVQRDKATRKRTFVPEFVTGGFSAVCTNNSEQEWDIEPDPNGAVYMFSWSEKNKRWQHGGNTGLWLRIGRKEFYDYNF